MSTYSNLVPSYTQILATDIQHVEKYINCICLEKICILVEGTVNIGPGLWNSLSPHMKTLGSLNSFKHKIKKHHFKTLQKKNDIFVLFKDFNFFLFLIIFK